MAKKSEKKKEPPPAETGGKNGKAKIAAVLIAAAVIGCIVLALNVGGLAKMAVEKIASETLGAPVSITALNISLQDKTIAVSGLRIGNPPGYSQPYAATVDAIAIAAEDVGKEKMTFSEIKVGGARLHLEVKKDGANFAALRRNAALKAAEKSHKPGEEVKVIVRNLVIEDAMLDPGTTLMGTAPAPLTLPDIRIRGIGEKEAGVPASQAIAQITDYVTRVAVNTAAQQGFLKGMNQESLQAIQQQFGLSSGFMDQVRGLGDKVKGIFDN